MSTPETPFTSLWSNGPLPTNRTIPNDTSMVRNCTNSTCEEFEPYWYLYDLADDIFIKFLYVSVIAGGLGNLFAIIVMLSSKKTRSSVPGLLLICLTTSDTVYLVAKRLQVAGFNLYSCIITVTVGETAMIISSVLILTTSITRYLVVAYPLKCLWVSSYKKIMILVTVVVIFSGGLVSAFAFLIAYDEDFDYCYIDENHGDVYFIFALVVHNGICEFLFSLIIIVFSLLTIRTVSGSSTDLGIRTGQNQANRRIKQEKIITKFLLLITLSYVITHLPYGVTWAVDYHLYSGDPTLYFIMKICHCLYMCSYSINVLLYCIGCASFRRDTVNLSRRLCCPHRLKYTDSRRTGQVSMPTESTTSSRF